MSIENFLAARACLLPPLTEQAVAADLLSSAADAILAGKLETAGELLRRADMPALFEFGRRLMGVEDREVHRRRLGPPVSARTAKVVARMPGSAETRALFERDGWRCRFCGCRVVSSRARNAMRDCLPGAVPWSEKEGYHGGFYALTASVDHVLPHSAGGGNDLANLLTACWPCQFGRGAWTIEEVGLMDPRSRPPLTDDWDGLTRLSKGRATTAIVEASLAGVSSDRPVVTSLNGKPSAATSDRVFSSDQARWLATLDLIQLPPSRRILEFLDSCADLGVSWSLNKVLLARMRVGTAVVEFVGIDPNGDVHLPWSLGGRKDDFKAFAEILARGIPGAVCYETPKQWNVSRPEKKYLNLNEVLGALPLLRSALETLYADLVASASESPVL